MHEPSSLLYDKNGEEYYNLISVLHKSMRNSNPDAAVYWMYRMLDGGETDENAVPARCISGQAVLLANGAGG